MEDRWFKGVWIPKDIWLRRDISSLAKMVLIEIDSLDKWEWCFASNDYFSEFFAVNDRQIKRALKELRDLDLIETVSFNWRKRVLRSKICPGRQDKNVPADRTKTSPIYNNIDNNIEYNISKDILLSEEVKDEWEILDNIANTEVKEVKQYWKPEINELIWAIKEECDRLWVAYVKKKERNFSQLILTSKDYWELCEKLWMSRTEFAVNILKASVAIWYFKWACSWPMRIYENYAEVYNLTKQKSDKNKQIEQNFTSLY